MRIARERPLIPQRTENSGSQSTCVVIAREAGDYTVATSMVPPEPCQVHEYAIALFSYAILSYHA